MASFDLADRLRGLEVACGGLGFSHWHLSEKRETLHGLLVGDVGGCQRALLRSSPGRHNCKRIHQLTALVREAHGVSHLVIPA